MENAAIPDRHHELHGNDQIRTVNLIKSARVGYTKMLLGVSGILLSITRNSLLFSAHGFCR